MYLFIFESLGTSELIMIGIVALIFLGPRRLPEIARKIGKMMAEFRSTASEFRETWEREVDFEEEQKALRLDLIEEETNSKPGPVARENSILPSSSTAAPEIRQIDKEQFEALKKAAGNDNSNGEPTLATEPTVPVEEPDLLSDKRNWL